MSEDTPEQPVEPAPEPPPLVQNPAAGEYAERGQNQSDIEIKEHDWPYGDESVPAGEVP